MKNQLLLFAVLCFPMLATASLEKDGTCNILSLIPLSEAKPPKPPKPGQDPPPNVDRWPASVLNHLGFSFAASAQLAIDHFNTRDSSVVPELPELTQGCTVTIPSQTIVDSQFSDVSASHGILFGTTKDQGGGVDGDNNDEVCTSQRKWCAVIGPSGDRAASQSSAITSMLRIPQMIHNTDDMLANRNPATITIVASMDVKAQAMASYLQDREYLMVIHDRLPVTRSIAESLVDLQDRERVFHGLVAMETLPGQGPLDMVQAAKSYGYKTIFLALSKPTDLIEYAEALYVQGMLNDKEYLYVLMEEAVSLDSVGDIFGYHHPGSPIDRLLTGALVISRIDKFATAATEEEDPFLSSWKAQNVSMVERVNQLVAIALEKSTPKPRDGEEPPKFYKADPTFFQDTLPAALSSHVYDSVMAVGIGACVLQRQRELKAREDVNSTLNAKNPHSSLPRPGDERWLQQPIETEGGNDNTPEAMPSDGDRSGMSLSRHQNDFQTTILATKFTGASGSIGFEAELPRYRNWEGNIIGVYNIRPTSINDEGRRTYTSALTSYTYSARDSLLWIPGPSGDFIYRDGTTWAPKTLREIAEENHLSPFVQAMGIALFGSSAIFSLVSCGLVWHLRNDGPVLAGQPPFLYMLCAGALLLSIAIFTLSWDESFGWSSKSLSIACTLTTWFFFVGHLMVFSAMFTKLWRLDQVLQFQRAKKVTVAQVIAPLIGLLLVAVVLLSVWTAVDPWVWERMLTNENPAETYGKCTCNHFREFFYSLAGLLVFGKVLTAAMAWKTADISQDFSDASSVFYAILLHIQAWFIGIPILAVLGDDNADAVYFGRVLLIWIFAVSAVGLVVVPKLISAYYQRRNPDRESTRVRVSGLYDSHRPGLSDSMPDSTRKIASVRSFRSNGPSSNTSQVDDSSHPTDERNSKRSTRTSSMTSLPLETIPSEPFTSREITESEGPGFEKEGDALEKENAAAAGTSAPTTNLDMESGC